LRHAAERLDAANAKDAVAQDDEHLKRVAACPAVYAGELGEAGWLAKLRRSPHPLTEKTDSGMIRSLG